MQRCAMALFGISALLTSAASAATLVPVTAFPGSTVTNVSGINDTFDISGNYTTADGIEHGFFGPLGGTYTSFDYGGTALGTEARSINNVGNIVGFAPDTSYASGPAFFRLASGDIKTFMKSGVVLDGIAQGLNKHNLSVGDYISDPSTNTQNGYQGKKGKYQHDLDIGIVVKRVDARAITDGGIIAGWYVDTADHGFVLTGSTLQTIDVDDSGTTTLEGLNAAGLATGSVLDVDSNPHAFIVDTNTNIVTWIDVPGATDTQAWSINKRGFVAVSTDIGSFIYCPFKPAHCPSGGAEIVERTTKLLPQGVPVRPGAARRQRWGAAR